MVHGHGGITLELHKTIAFHCNLRRGTRMFFYTTSGWIMWNIQMSGLLTGTTLCIFDGSPGGATVDAAGNKQSPDWTTLWRFAAETGVTWFGAGAAFCAGAFLVGVGAGDFFATGFGAGAAFFAGAGEAVFDAVAVAFFVLNCRPPSPMPRRLHHPNDDRVPCGAR